MLMAGPDPVLCLPARQASDNNLDEVCPMDEGERLDYADQEPLPFPTPTEALGPMEQFLSAMYYFMEGIEERLQRALDALPVPSPGPPPDGISIHEAIPVSCVKSTSQLW